MMNQKLKILFSLTFLACLLVVLPDGHRLYGQKKEGIKHLEKKELKMRHVEWSRKANIYEVNMRQNTEAGTINAFREHLPRLKKMGVDILWIMPIQPIGEENRKGSLGSYYSVKDYTAVNPEFGTMEDFKAMVKEIHDLGMHVIIDWVANHSSWDNVWAKEHPEFYEKKEDGTFNSPFDWTDVIAFDYNNPAMRDSMYKALEFWVKETDIDGYRCDVAGMVPTDFWNEARTRLDKIKPVFMLAEDEDNVSLVEYAFDMNYTWKMLHLMNDIAKGEKGVSEIWKNLEWSAETFPSDTYRMYFTTNHDENSWNGTTKERLGDGAQAFAVLTYVLPGMPLVYSGQEAGNDKRLRFFDKDTIDWSRLPLESFYTKLNAMKKENKALWNGVAGGPILDITNGKNDKVFACERHKDGNRVVAVINLSDKQQMLTLNEDANTGEFEELFTGKKVFIEKGQQFVLEPWDYVVLIGR
jgi:glycosidase